VLSGPDELRRAALESVLEWHFTHDQANSTRMVQIAFELPKGDSEFNKLNSDRQLSALETAVRGAAPQAAGQAAAAAPAAVIPLIGGGVQSDAQAGVTGGVLRGVIGGVPSNVLPAPPLPSSFHLTGITVSGLPEQSTNELLATLPVHQGDVVTGADLARVTQAVQAFDQHLRIQRSASRSSDGTDEMSLQIIAPGAAPVLSSGIGLIKVGGNVQSNMIVTKVAPVYPQLAKAARVEGVVHLTVVIANDGTVQEVQAINGPALLISSAVDAVKQWVYKPTLLNGEPIAVVTTVDVNFTLNQ
jgi:TonB family protein